MSLVRWIGRLKGVAQFVSGGKSTLRYFLRVLIGIDQLVNALLAPFLNRLYWGMWSGPFGDPDETLSSVLGKIRRKNGGQIPKSMALVYWVDRLLERIDPNHSIDAIEEDEGDSEWHA